MLINVRISHFKVKSNKLNYHINLALLPRQAMPRSEVEWRLDGAAVPVAGKYNYAFGAKLFAMHTNTSSNTSAAHCEFQ